MQKRWYQIIYITGMVLWVLASLFGATIVQMASFSARQTKWTKGGKSAEFEHTAVYTWYEQTFSWSFIGVREWKWLIINNNEINIQLMLQIQSLEKQKQDDWY